MHPEPVNFMEQLIQGSISLEPYADIADANLKHNSPTQISDAFEVTQAIILSSMAVKADEVEEEIEELGDNKLIGLKMMNFFKKQNAVYLTKAMFHNLLSLHKKIIPKVAKGKVNIYSQISLLAVIKLLRTNLKCLTVCKITLSQILSAKELDMFRELREDYLPMIQPFETDAKAEERTSEEVY